MSHSTCSAPKCELPIHGRGVCRGHYDALRRPPAAKSNDSEARTLRFWAKVEKTAGCWIWHGTLDPHGYGEFAVGNMARRAHRIAYEMCGGRLMPPLVLDHLCRNRRCVNPAHLEQVTDRVNILRGESPSAVNARKTHCINGHELAGANLYIHESHGSVNRKCRACMAAANKRRAHKMRLARTVQVSHRVEAPAL